MQLALSPAPLLAAEKKTQVPPGYQLEQVVVLSRHGIRAPLVNYGDALAEATPQKWPVWQTGGGLLTPKGAAVEQHVGRYFQQWLAQTRLIPQDGCPADQQVFIYANSLPRTIDTAKAFLAGAFPECKIAVTHQAAVGTMDPTFNPIITADVTDSFRHNALDSVNRHAGAGGIDGLNQRLKPNYSLLQDVLDYRQGTACQRDKTCDLAAQPSSVTLITGKEPGINGPLRTATGATDAFMLQYYEGFPLKDVAWGKVTTDKQWRRLETIKNLYHETLFGSPAIAANAAKPLLGFIAGALDIQPAADANQQAAQRAKMTLLAGHDSNIASLLAALHTRDYRLPGQFERTPISGAVVFQRWHDPKQNRDLMKMEYVYPTASQIRNTSPLSLSAPPQRVTLTIGGCTVDADGFCPMTQFKQAVLKDLQG
ncbi:bifunctional glucose-1-phosphatase/inositol phosphatase [Enterobacteriales bacterium SAP-6]|uniref:Bifunctional glucose-1-phosphatase/inositol phosphatase n=2 Tax=Acerihabitans arboris TaxID=2691583 RepID=A0A845SLS2_9GAMM|nr:bifunctional glucose-1-phosphatase/inositol phosphatase [Acerihabitans arboris]